jgi:hypothetical protein
MAFRGYSVNANLTPDYRFAYESVA